MLWLALRFPSLPLEVYARAARASDPLAVTKASGSRSEVIACNDGAIKRGVKAGMPVAAASALASDLKLVPRDITAERGALERIAAWSNQFTPAVSLAEEAEVLLEIEGSLALYGGLTRLWNAVGEGLRAMGYAATIACAPTPLAAQWFVRAGLAVRLRHVDALRASLPHLPVHVIDLPAEARLLLQNVGVETLGDCLKLPRDGLARRLGPAFVAQLDRALGCVPDPRPFFTPPTVFKAAQPLPAPAQEADMLLFAARRMLVELCGYLCATAQGVQRLAFSFAHHRHEPTCVRLKLVQATRDPDHLTSVLRERLDRTALPCPATDIALESELMLPLARASQSFLPDAGRHEEAAAHLIERLRARLGEEAVTGLKRCPDHRPERAWRACEPGSKDANAAAALPRRPLWLLARPRPLDERGEVPCYDGKLALLAGPERIESGWWDGHDVTRDYFVASNAADALLWIYRERASGGGWFLHGFFA
ncbi:MAG: Y-family DNA polymerase [Burkholderiales bacterium]